MDKSDFEELDRAVQSLTNSTNSPTQKPTQPSDQSQPASQLEPAAPAADTSSTATPATPEPAAPAEPVAPAPSEQTTPQRTVVTQRPRGRFMDIVPPRKTTAKAPTAAPSRSGLSVAPPADTTAEKPAQTPVPAEPSQVEASPVADTEEPAPIAQPVEDIAAKPAPVQSEDIPAPSEQAEAKVEDKLVDLAKSEASDSPQDNLDDEINSLVDLTQDDDQTPASPFISGANVEKRPLGKEPTPGQVDEPVADPVDTIEKEPDTSQANVQDTQSSLEQPKPQDQQPVRNKMKGAKVSPAPIGNDGPTSISQQYKVQPDDKSAEPANTSSMYDAENYTQPLAHPAKKKSGWLGVFWIILLLAIGGGGAFIAYQLQLF